MEYLEIENILHPQVCKKIVSKLIETLGDEVDMGDEDVYSRCYFYDPYFTTVIWNRIKEVLWSLDPTICGIRPEWAAQKYRKGRGCIDIHMDNNSIHDNKISKYTILIYLNDNFTGGETELFPNGEDNESILIKPQTGMAFIQFQKILHKGNKPIDGDKYIIRSDILVTG